MNIRFAIIALAWSLAVPALAVDLEVAEEDEFMDEFAFLEDAGTVELAARHKQEIGMSPSAITVITREDIETTGANTLPNLLRIVPGMEMLYLGINAGTPVGRLHYTESNFHYLVLIDGREVNIEVLGQTVWEALPISMEDVERIEILRGPASALYGANALSGVISITTRAISEKTTGWAMASAGELGLTRLGARASTRLGNWGFSIGGNVDLLGTFTDPHATSMDMWKLRALAEHRWSESARSLIDGAASIGTGPRNTSLGILNIDFTQFAVRLAHESENLMGRLYWFYLSTFVDMEAALEFEGLHLADVKPAMIRNHTIDGEVQWTLPRFWDPLLLRELHGHHQPRLPRSGDQPLGDARQRFPAGGAQGRGLGHAHRGHPAGLQHGDWLVSQPAAGHSVHADRRAVPAPHCRSGISQTLLPGEGHPPGR
jgi:hypothetical protein